ncbi:MAG: putative nucleic acid-binding Zn-ribbon protein [Cryomorphaceae bacterium]|jgi:predicted  nucleic acid-binding Zn-ribbon protein
METFTNIILERFTWGLALGLILLFLSWNSARKDKKHLKTEIKRVTSENSDLQTHLGTQLKINAKGNETLQAQLDEMRLQNETLRVNIQTLQQKPGKVEQRKLEIMETAVSTMREQAPGFAAAWEKSIRSAEDDLQSAESGLKKLIHKIVPGFRATPSIATSREMDDADAKTIQIDSAKEG